MSSKSYVVIVDALSTYTLIAPSFRRLGYKMIHVQSSNSMAEAFLKNLIRSDFEICLSAGDFPNHLSLVEFLSNYSIECIVPGNDSGVILADELAHSLGIIKNDPSLILARRSKFLMHETLRANNLLCAKQIKSHSIDEILSWYEKQDFTKTILKPEFAVLSEGVHFCKNKEDLIKAFEAVIGTKIVFGLTNSSLVIQEYLPGPEYMVNTVSVNGEHFITDIWLGVDEDEEKLSADLYATLLRPGNEHYEEISSYAKEVLSCMGIQRGPAHIEIRYSPKGPVLIEIGARLQGALSQKAFSFAIGLNPAELAVDSYVRPEKALKILNKKREWRHARLVYFYSAISGLIVKAPNLTKMYELQSVQDVLISMNPGEMLHKTDDIPGRQGYAYLVNECEEELAKDYEKFIALEQELYQEMLKATNTHTRN